MTNPFKGLFAMLVITVGVSLISCPTIAQEQQISSASMSMNLLVPTTTHGNINLSYNRWSASGVNGQAEEAYLEITSDTVDFQVLYYLDSSRPPRITIKGGFDSSIFLSSYNKPSPDNSVDLTVLSAYSDGYHAWQQVMDIAVELNCQEDFLSGVMMSEDWIEMQSVLSDISEGRCYPHLFINIPCTGEFASTLPGPTDDVCVASCGVRAEVVPSQSWSLAGKLVQYISLRELDPFLDINVFYNAINWQDADYIYIRLDNDGPGNNQDVTYLARIDLANGTYQTTGGPAENALEEEEVIQIMRDMLTRLKNNFVLDAYHDGLINKLLSIIA